MTYQDNPLYDIDPRLIARYLRHIGWQSAPVKSDLQRLFLSFDKNESQIEIFLNSNAVAEQKIKQAFFAVKTLSDWYEKSTYQIAREIVSLTYDLIASRIPDEYVRNDSVQLRIASQFINKSKDFLASSATTEITNERHFKRTRKEAIDYAEKCRFGHTFRGSFGFLIESPVGFNDEPSLLEEAPDSLPLGRRVVERIIRGLNSLSDAVNEQSTSAITKQSDGFSANMCDSIADMIEETDVSKISIDIKLSPEWTFRSPQITNSKFVVEMKSIEMLRDAAKSLRVEEKPRPVSVYGRITMLETEGNPALLLEDLASRELEVNWVNEEGQIIHVKLLVSPENYIQAVEAHKNGHPVSATGMLTRVGRSWRLEQVNSFNILQV